MVRKDGRGGADGGGRVCACVCVYVCVCVRRDGYISRNGSFAVHILSVLPTP